MNVFALKQQALAKVEAAYVAAEAHYGRKFTRVPVEFSAKQKVTAGTAHFSRNFATGKITPVKIKLSLPLLILNGDKFIEDTPGHEAAHLISIEQYGGAGEGHGTCWKQVMRVIGQQASRTHNMKTAVTRIEVFCSCKSHMVTKAVAQKVLAGRKYTCNLCYAVITLKGTNVVEPKTAASVATAPGFVPTLPSNRVIESMVANLKQSRPGLSVDQFLSVDGVVQQGALAAKTDATTTRILIRKAWKAS